MTTASLPILLFRQRIKSGLILLFPFFLYSCKRNAEPAPVPQNNNEVKANVVLSSSNTVIINATGTKAKIGKSIFGYTHISGVNDGNAGVIVDFQTVTTPGTYPVSCEYRVNTISQTTPIYVNASSFVTNRGNVTITAVMGHHIEGSFVATSKHI